MKLSQPALAVVSPLLQLCSRSLRREVFKCDPPQVGGVLLRASWLPGTLVGRAGGGLGAGPPPRHQGHRGSWCWQGEDLLLTEPRKGRSWGILVLRAP